MVSIDPEWAALQKWPIGLDQRGLATVEELEMARAPLRRPCDRVVSAGGCVRGPDWPTPGGDRSESRSRPGKRW
jgi:hypothetical protein